MKYILSLAAMLAVCSFSFSQKTDDEIKKIMENSKNFVLNLNSSVINKDGAFIIPVPKNNNEDITWKSETNCKCVTCKCTDCKCTDGVCKCCDSKNCATCTTGACASVTPTQVNKKIIVISALAWCAPCQLLEKETLSNEQVKSAVTIERHDGDKEPNILSAFNVKQYPTIIYYEDNKELWRVQEFIRPETLLSLINKKSTEAAPAPVAQAPLTSITGNCASGNCATSSVMYSAPMIYSGNYFYGNRVFSSGNCSSGNCR